MMHTCNNCGYSTKNKTSYNNHLKRINPCKPKPQTEPQPQPTPQTEPQPTPQTEPTPQQDETQQQRRPQKVERFSNNIVNTIENTFNYENNIDFELYLPYSYKDEQEKNFSTSKLYYAMMDVINANHKDKLYDAMNVMIENNNSLVKGGMKIKNKDTGDYMYHWNDSLSRAERFILMFSIYITGHHPTIFDP
jgi:hypothetical protein